MLRTVKLLMLVILLLGIAACKKKNIEPGTAPPPPPPPPPVSATHTVTSFTITDSCKRTVTINGTNFNPDISKDSVFFGSTKGIIDSATSTKIFARYPAGNVSGSIMVYCNGAAVTFGGFFNIAAPVITSVSPIKVGPGARITINGLNFNPTVADSVFIGGVKATVITASTTQIVAQVPPATTSGSITVYARCQFVTLLGALDIANRSIVYASSNSGVCYAIDVPTGTVLWTVQTNSGYRSSPTYKNGVIYIGSSDVNNLSNNRMYALDALSGYKLWTYDAGPWDQVPLIHDGVLYAGAFDKKFYALNAATGQKIWSYTAGEYFRSDGPTYHDGKIYCRNDDGHFYCLDAATGSLVWRKMIWPGGNPAAAGGIIYTAGSGMLYALDAATGAAVWTRTIPYLSGSSPTIVNGVLYIAAENHQIYAMNAANGDILWQIEASWWVASAVYVVNNVLYVHSGDGVIGAVNATTGGILWSRALPASFLTGACPVVANGILFVGDNNGSLHALDAATGTVKWVVHVGTYPMISSPVVVDANGVVYYAGDSGNHQ